MSETWPATLQVLSTTDHEEVDLVHTPNRLLECCSVQLERISDHDHVWMYLRCGKLEGAAVCEMVRCECQDGRMNHNFRKPERQHETGVSGNVSATSSLSRVAPAE